MLVAAAVGDLPRPNVCIFSNTQWEPPAVIDHVKFLTEWSARHGLEVCTVTAGSIRDDRGANQMPLSILKPDGSVAKMGRQCTTDYKLVPIRREVRRRLGYRPYQKWRHQLETWLGITIDEAHRMKPAKEPWETVRWPLVELGWNREDCKRYLERHDLPVPMKSSCVGCPYHSDKYFREMKLNRPKEWRDAVSFDNSLRSGEFTIRGVEGQAYLHRKCIPLKDVYLQEDQRDLFGEECSGYCEA